MPRMQQWYKGSRPKTEATMEDEMSWTRGTCGRAETFIIVLARILESSWDI
jgi:hypothetical protein